MAFEGGFVCHDDTHIAFLSFEAAAGDDSCRDGRAISSLDNLFDLMASSLIRFRFPLALLTLGLLVLFVFLTDQGSCIILRLRELLSLLLGILLLVGDGLLLESHDFLNVGPMNNLSNILLVLVLLKIVDKS